MMEETIVRLAAPTLAGIKTGSLFNCAFNDRDELLADIRNMNHSLLEKGLCMLPLRFDEGSVLIYLFRAGLLRKDLADAESVRILKEAGYRQPAYPYCLTELGRRLNAKNGFPHEIGLFLGYPPEDVRGFIENRAKGSRLTGYWKVYGDVNAAKKRFEAFRKCTDYFSRQFERGHTVLQLAAEI